MAYPHLRNAHHDRLRALSSLVEISRAFRQSIAVLIGITNPGINNELRERIIDRFNRAYYEALINAFFQAAQPISTTSEMQEYRTIILRYYTDPSRSFDLPLAVRLFQSGPTPEDFGLPNMGDINFWDISETEEDIANPQINNLIREAPMPEVLPRILSRLTIELPSADPQMSSPQSDSPRGPQNSPTTRPGE